MRVASPSAPLTIIKNISQKCESQPNVSSCPANFTPVKMPRFFKHESLHKMLKKSMKNYNLLKIFKEMLRFFESF